LSSDMIELGNSDPCLYISKIKCHLHKKRRGL
jgi:hypothetical protein